MGSSSDANSRQTVSGLFVCAQGGSWRGSETQTSIALHADGTANYSFTHRECGSGFQAARKVIYTDGRFHETGCANGLQMELRLAGLADTAGRSLTAAGPIQSVRRNQKDRPRVFSLLLDDAVPGSRTLTVEGPLDDSPHLGIKCQCKRVLREQPLLLRAGGVSMSMSSAETDATCTDSVTTASVRTTSRHSGT